ncbi:MAG: alpha/beta hydrolase [Actinomycetota bacterium]|nr:alpha/beta hydrolase [Actinomycetota bacterium]
MATASVGGLDIRYEDTGGDGSVVLFSHGLLMDHTMFDAQVDALGDRYRCVRWDEPGFGDTRATSPFTLWDSANLAVGLLDHLGVEQAVFAGMSQGGFLSLRAALTAPERVRALVMIDSAADPDSPAMATENAKMFHLLCEGSEERRAKVLASVAGILIGDPAHEAHWIARWERIDRAQLRLAGDALLAHDDVTDRLDEIGCPALVIHGRDDHAIELARAEAVCAGLADCRGLVVVDGAAHAPNVTHPTPVNEALATFLATLA